MEKLHIVDLTYPVTSEMLVYPGTERPSFQWIGRVNSEGYNLTRMTMLVHTGTHVDAPLHFIEGGRAIDELPLNCFYGPAKIIKLKEKPESKEINLKSIIMSGIKLNENDIIIISTGISEYSKGIEYNFQYPYPSEELINWLIEKKIKAYMTDATSIDPVSAKESPRHKQLLGAGIPIVENLCNLNELPNNKEFIVCALPLKLIGREGSLCRAVALLDFGI